MYDEYEDAFWCGSCGNYISAHELDMQVEITEDIRDEIDSQLGYDPLFNNYNTENYDI